MNDAFYLVIYGWLNKACHFFEENNMDDEVEQVQSLTLQVLGNPQIIRLIWSQIGNRQGKIEELSKKIYIFRKSLEKPTQNIQKFLLLILVLSGNKKEPMGTNIMEMLMNTSTGEQNF